VAYRGLYCYWQRGQVLLFSQTFFLIVSACWASLQKSLNGLTRAIAHLHGRCFQLSTNLNKDFLRYLWYCGKKQVGCGLLWCVLSSTRIHAITVVTIGCVHLMSTQHFDYCDDVYCCRWAHTMLNHFQFVN